MATDNKIVGTYEVSPASGYTGDVAPQTAFKILSENKDAVLIDVRTRPEWNYVGLPELGSIGKKPALLEWQVFPSMQPNPDFVTALSGAVADKAAPLLFLCRSGARSAAAAKAMTAAGTVRVLIYRTASRGRWTRKPSAARREAGKRQDFRGGRVDPNSIADHRQ